MNHLDGFVLQTQSVQSVNGFLGILGSVIVDKSVAQTLPCFQIEKFEKKRKTRWCIRILSISSTLISRLVHPPKNNYNIALKFKTCNFVADEFAAFNFADGSEKRTDLLLRHGLRQVVDDQIGLAFVIFGHDVLGSLKNETAKCCQRNAENQMRVPIMRLRKMRQTNPLTWLTLLTDATWLSPLAVKAPCWGRLSKPFILCCRNL